jgi:hypothetical protein
MYLPGRAKMHFTKANLVSGIVTMRIYEREAVRYVHILLCFVVLVSLNGNIQLLHNLYPFRRANIRFFPHIEVPTKNNISKAIRDLKQGAIIFFAGLIKHEGLKF